MTGAPLFGETVTRWTAAEMRAALATARPSPEYALLHEVRNGAGFNADRSCDAISMGLWPSRGLKLEGFEIKVSRQDWLSELANPAKAESFARWVDHWWIFAPDGVVHADEVPENWGWLSVDDRRRVRVSKAAPTLAPEPLSRAFLAALLKREDGMVEKEIERRLELLRREQRETFAASVQAEVDRRTKDLGELAELDRTVREAFGVSAGLWFSLSDAIEIVRFVAKTHLHGNWSGVGSIVRTVDRAADEATQLAAKLRTELATIGIAVPTEAERAAKREADAARVRKRKVRA